MKSSNNRKSNPSAQAQSAPVGREQELKSHSTVTGAGEVSVAHTHLETGSDPDYGTHLHGEDDGTQSSLADMEDRDIASDSQV